MLVDTFWSTKKPINSVETDKATCAKWWFEFKGYDRLIHCILLYSVNVITLFENGVWIYLCMIIQNSFGNIF